MSSCNRSYAELRLACLALTVLVCGVWSACSRKADIYDEPASTVTPTPTGAPPDGGLTEIDGAFSDPAQPDCTRRGEDQNCRSSNDFPCNFDALVDAVKRDCQLESGCTANGWLAAELGDDGCATRLEMSEVNDKFVACAIERFSTVRCPCGKSRSQIYLGLGNNGCPDGGPRACSSGELPCDPGEICVRGVCLPDGSGGAAQ